MSQADSGIEVAPNFPRALGSSSAARSFDGHVVQEKGHLVLLSVLYFAGLDGSARSSLCPQPLLLVGHLLLTQHASEILQLASFFLGLFAESSVRRTHEKTGPSHKCSTPPN